MMTHTLTHNSSSANLIAYTESHTNRQTQTLIYFIRLGNNENIDTLTHAQMGERSKQFSERTNDRA